MQMQTEEKYPAFLLPEDEACQNGLVPDSCEQKLRGTDGLAALPEDEDCRSGAVPESCEQKIWVADCLATLPKLFF